MRLELLGEVDNGGFVEVSFVVEPWRLLVGAKPITEVDVVGMLAVDAVLFVLVVGEAVTVGLIVTVAVELSAPFAFSKFRDVKLGKYTYSQHQHKHSQVYNTLLPERPGSLNTPVGNQLLVESKIALAHSSPHHPAQNL